jgi:hypothetical protein
MHPSFRIAAIVAAFGITATAALAQDQSVTVVVNGQTVPFDQPPIERAGRVFVPLRGVFERLGATVVYANGEINATRRNTTVSLHIGSNNAVVNGQPETLDVAPFLVGARTLVPLRFVSQALGAVVNFDQNRQTVYVSRPGGGDGPPPVAQAQAPAPMQLTGFRDEPSDGAQVTEKRPQISTTFRRPVDPNSVHITIDDRDVTSNAYVSNRSVSFTPSFDLPYGKHAVRVTARGEGGARLDSTWAFTNVTAEISNAIDDLQPRDGESVGRRFEVVGHTRPGSTVRVVAVANEAIGFRDVPEGRSSNQGIAGPDGGFRVPVEIADRGAGIVDVRVQSTSRDGAVTVRTIHLRPNF